MAQVQRAKSAKVRKAEYAPIVRAAAAKYRIPEALLAAVIETESGWDPDAVSKKGAQGLGQLMPATAKTLGVTDPFDPTQNISASARLLSTLVTKYGGNVVLALAAYNAGEPAVDKVQGVPNIPETLNYIKKVDKALTSGNIQRQEGGPPSPVSIVSRESVGPVGAKKMPGDYIAIDRGGRPPPGAGVPGASGSASKLPGEYIAVDRGGKPPPVQQTAAGTYNVPGIGQISNAQMEEALKKIAEEMAEVPLDRSREFTELQSGAYGLPDDSNAFIDSFASGARGHSGQPSLAPFYSGGVMQSEEPSGLGWLSRLFRPSGGPTFTDWPQSER